MQTLLNDVKHKLTSADIQTISDSCHGYVGADLSSLCREAGFHAVQKSVNRGETSVPSLTIGEFRHALTIVKPSAMREVAIEVPKVRMSFTPILNSHIHRMANESIFKFKNCICVGIANLYPNVQKIVMKSLVYL